MRKLFVCLALMLALSVAGLCTAHYAVNRNREAVTYTEHTLSGDREAAQGLTLDLSLHTNYRLFWHSQVPLGDPSAATTRFTLHTRGHHTEHMPELYFRLGTGVGSSIASSSPLDLSEDQGLAAIELVEIARDVASRTPPGQSHTETVRLADYYDFYPLYPYYNYKGAGGLSHDFYTALCNYIKIGVPQEQQLAATVVTDSQGGVTSFSADNVLSYGDSLYTASTVTPDAVYFTLMNLRFDGQLLDLSHLPQGFGIFRIPLEMRGGQLVYLTTPIERVFPIDALEADVLALEQSADGSALLLFTREQHTFYLTVIDAQTFEAVQKCPLGPADAVDIGIDTVYAYEDFLVVILHDQRFALLVPDAGGQYQLAFEGSTDIADSYLYQHVFAYQDGKLALAAFRPYSQDWARLYLAVYDRSGLLYAGKYAVSVDNSLASQLPQLEDEASLSLRWDS